jgi:uncharacterized protein YpmS
MMECVDDIHWVWCVVLLLSLVTIFAIVIFLVAAYGDGSQWEKEL